MAEPIDDVFSTSAMSAAFSAEAHLQGMLAFESALARAEARVGVIPQEAAESIGAMCRVELFDVAALYREAALTGTPVVPLVGMLRSHVTGDAQKYVHWGATSQDAIDTALMLHMREGLDLLLEGLLGVCAACALLAERYRPTLMAGRTLLQQALPITFGYKAARWLALVVRQVQVVRERRERTLAVQLGGAAGTLASLGKNGPSIVELLAEDIGLPVPDLPWHTERDRIAEVAGTLGVVAGAMGKIAGDIVLLSQTEVGEVSERAEPGKGGSSALPQKHNAVEAITAIASARLAVGEVPVLLSAMAQEHERAAGAWQAEWVAIPKLFRATGSAVERVRESLSGLQIDPTRMRANLDLTKVLIMSESLTVALTPHVGRPEAQRMVKDLCARAVESGEHLRQVTLEEQNVLTLLTPEEIEQALDPKEYLGCTEIFIDRALASYRAVQAAGGAG